MNLLQLISSEGLFGAERMMVHLSMALQQMGCVSIAGVFENAHRPHLEVADEAHRQGVPVEIFPCRGRIDWNAVRRIRKYIRERQVDVVHTHGYKSNLYGYLAALGLGVPLVATCHLWTRQSRAVQVYDYVDGFVIRRFDAVVGVSKAITDKIQKSGVDQRKITRISNGMDFTHLCNGVASLRCLAGSATVVIGTVGRLTEQKGLTYLLDAFAVLCRRHEEVHLLVVGEGKDRAKLEAVVKGKGLADKVTFVGLRRDVPDVFASIDIFALPSIDEGMPMALLEALAVGKAVVATRVGDVPMLVRHGQTGLLLEPRDVEGLLESLTCLLENPGLRSKLGIEGSRFVHENYSSEKMAREYLDLYEALLEKAKSA